MLAYEDLGFRPFLPQNHPGYSVGLEKLSLGQLCPKKVSLITLLYFEKLGLWKTRIQPLMPQKTPKLLMFCVGLEKLKDLDQLCPKTL